jgi:hypothetical protein
MAKVVKNPFISQLLSVAYEAHILLHLAINFFVSLIASLDQCNQIFASVAEVNMKHGHNHVFCPRPTNACIPRQTQMI